MRWRHRNKAPNIAYANTHNAPYVCECVLLTTKSKFKGPWTYSIKHPLMKFRTNIIVALASIDFWCGVFFLHLSPRRIFPPFISLVISAANKLINIITIVSITVLSCSVCIGTSKCQRIQSSTCNGIYVIFFSLCYANHETIPSSMEGQVNEKNNDPLLLLKCLIHN